MRFSYVLIATALLATPALAQSSSGNVGQPERGVPQAGNTAGGPIDKPSTRDMAPTRTESTPVGEGGMSSGAGSVDSAKGGNASDPTRAAPNTGGTSGGPSR